MAGVGADSTGTIPDSLWRGPSVVRRSAAARYHFVPEERAIAAPFAADPTDWRLTAGPAPGVRGVVNVRDSSARSGIPERYTPPYAAVVIPITRWQAGFIRRGDSAAIVASVDLGRELPLRAAILPGMQPNARWDYGLVGFSRLDKVGAPRDTLRLVHDSAKVLPPKWSGVIAAPWDSTLIGFEALGDGLETSGGGPAKMLARVRAGISPPSQQQRQRVLMSDVFLYDMTMDAPAALDSAGLDRLLPSTVADSAAKIGLYWEQYGLRADERSTVRLEVIPLTVRRGLIGGLVRSVTRTTEVALKREWTDTASVAVARHTRLDLAGLAVGDYEIRMTVSAPGQRAISASRRITIIR
jgi:hypothetical protein